MSVNKHKPHVLILPEDEANERIANGFQQHLSVKGGVIHILRPAGGWEKALRQISQGGDYWSRINNPCCHFVVMIDFDNQFPTRFQYAQNAISPSVSNKIFILGSPIHPESLRNALNRTLERIGSDLAEACSNPTSPYSLWDHDLLKHNQPELQRLTSTVRPLIF